MKKLEVNLEVKKLNEDESDKGWEMITEMNENWFKNLYFLNEGNHWTISKTVSSIYELYKEKNNIELYLKYYYNYLGVALYPETIYNEETFMKFILYAYTLN